MISLKKACELVEPGFIEDGYDGIQEVRETEDSFFFTGKLSKPMYGGFDVLFPKDGSDPICISVAEEPYKSMWDNANVVEVV